MNSIAESDSCKTSCVIGIAGGSCSGKGYLCQHLLAQLGSSKCLILPMDCYYKDLSHLSLDERSAINFDHPDALDYELFHEHLKILLSGGTVSKPFYDFQTHTRSVRCKEEINAKGKIILVDGIFALYWSGIRTLYNIKIFIDLDTKICLKRRMKRDIKERDRTCESVERQFRETVLPMYLANIASSKEYADIVLPGDALIEEAANQVLKFILAEVTI